MYPGRGRRPRRPASPLASPLASPCARRAGDVAPYHNNMVGIMRHLVFPCIPGRGRRPRRPAFPMASPLASPCARRAGDVAPYHNNMVGIMRHLVFPCIPGRGRRPRRPASRWRLRWRPRVRGAPGTSRPTIITCSPSYGTLCSRVSLITWLASCGTLCSRVSLVGADVPGGPRPRWRLRWRPRVRGAPGRRALPG